MAVQKKLSPVHPGEILAEELAEIGLSMNAFAKALHVPANRITAIVKGERGITGETALRLARYLGTSPGMWLNLQSHFELEVARDRFAAAVEKEIKPRAA
jgi:addiction module HigA family antidote